MPGSDMTSGKDPILLINLTPPMWTTCARCGADTMVGWGFPAQNGRIVPTWWPEWDGGIPACEPCYEWHLGWSEKLAAPFEAPLV